MELITYVEVRIRRSICPKSPENHCSVKFGAPLTCVSNVTVRGTGQVSVMPGPFRYGDVNIVNLNLIRSNKPNVTYVHVVRVGVRVEAGTATDADVQGTGLISVTRVFRATDRLNFK